MPPWWAWLQTICKQTCDLCSNAAPFNNVDYVLFGYNATGGNPTGNTVDPGFKSRTPIFVGTYNQQLETKDKKHLVLDGFSAQLVHSCSTAFRSEVADSASVEEYENELSIMFGASGGYAGFEFSAATEYTERTEQMIAEHMTRVESSAECLRYKVSQNADAPPQTTEGFKASVAGLGSDEEGYFGLFDKYGTHYTTSVTFGARQGYSALITKSARDTLQAQGINVEVAAEYEGTFSAGGNVGVGWEDEHRKQLSRALTDKEVFTIGIRWESDSEIWAQQADIKAMPVHYELASVCDLLSDPAKNAACKDAYFGKDQAYCKKRVHPNEPCRCDKTCGFVRPSPVGSCVGPPTIWKGSGYINMPKDDCSAMGGNPSATSGWVDCQFDWCTNGLYSAAKPGTCGNNKKGYGIVNMLAADCRRIEGAMNGNPNDNAWTACHLDWCVSPPAPVDYHADCPVWAGLMYCVVLYEVWMRQYCAASCGEGTGYVVGQYAAAPGRGGECRAPENKKAYGWIKSWGRDCEAMGGKVNGSPQLHEETWCHLDWCPQP